MDVIEGAAGGVVCKLFLVAVIPPIEGMDCDCDEASPRFPCQG